MPRAHLTWLNSRSLEPGSRLRLKSTYLLDTVMQLEHFQSGYQLAKEAGLQQATVNHLVYGRRSTCSAETARKISDALHRPWRSLFLIEEATVNLTPDGRAAA